MAKTQFPGRFNTLDVAFRPLPGDRPQLPPAEQTLLQKHAAALQRLAEARCDADPSEDEDVSDARADPAVDGGCEEEEEEKKEDSGAAVVSEADHDEEEGKENHSENKCLDSGGLGYCDEYYLGDCQATSDDLTTGKFRHLKDIVDKVVKEHKTFCVEGHYLPIRRAMKKRGWLEKREQTWPCKRLKESGLLSSKDKSPAVISRMLRNIPVDFLWTIRPDNTNWSDLRKRQIVNRFPRTGFNTKVGLCSSLQQLYWYYEEGIANTLFPRCYNIYNADELAAFKDDFRMTACISLLKWLVDTYENKTEQTLSSPEGKIPVTAVDFAISRCNEYISIQNHEDIDRDVYGQTWDHQWDQFLTWYYMAVHKNEHFTQIAEPSTLMLYNLAVYTLGKMDNYWSQMHLDGIFNIWIVKPGANSRGRGIQLMNRMEKVMAKVNPAVAKETRYVVQKYIERPLLIYNTKFDIRQWFLVTCVQPMTIWMYRESYLRFCSQCFDLLNFHESVHLCNNAVQCKYKNGKRDPKLPDENMWDCYTFQTYLRTLGKSEMWSQRIYPGMCESIVGALLASQENIYRKNNCFELFGADFILDEAFTPWLIEINSCPSMCESTSVTARMCAQCLEDVIKVVIDRRTNRKADTGMFELIFKQHIPPAPPYLGVSLSVRGHRICKADIAKIGLYRGSVKQTRKGSPEDSEVETQEMLPECEFVPDDEVMVTSENICPSPDTASLTPRTDTDSLDEKGRYDTKNVSYHKLCSRNRTSSCENVRPTIKKIADGVFNLFTEKLLCHKGIFSCADAAHEKNLQEAADNENKTEATTDQKRAPVPAEKTFNNATTAKLSKITDPQNKAITMQAQMKKNSDMPSLVPEHSSSSEDKAGKHLSKFKDINELKDIIKHEACFKTGSSSIVDRSKPNSKLTPLQLSPKYSPQIRFTPGTHSCETKTSKMASSFLKGKNELKKLNDRDKNTQEEETKQFFSHNITHAEMSQKQTVHFQNSYHKINSEIDTQAFTVKNTVVLDHHKESTLTHVYHEDTLFSDQNEQCDIIAIPTLGSQDNISSEINTNQLAFHLKHDSIEECSATTKNNTFTQPPKGMSTKEPAYPEHVTPSDCNNDNSPQEDKQINDSASPILISPDTELPLQKTSQECHDTQTLKSGNEIIMTNRAMIVRRTLQETTKNRKCKHIPTANLALKNILERKVLNNSAELLQAENATAMQTNTLINALPKNTEYNSAEKLWLNVEKNDARHTNEEIFKRKRLKSNSWKKNDETVRANEVYDQWRQKLAQTKASCEELLNTLKVFKESENVKGKLKNYISEKGPTTRDNGPSSRRVVSKINKRTHAEQEQTDSKSKKAQNQTEETCSGDKRNRLWNTSISYLSTLRESGLLRSRPTEDSRIQFISDNFTSVRHYNNVYTNNHPLVRSRLMLPQIKLKIGTAPDDTDATDDPVNEFYAIGMSLKAWQSGITQTEKIILPLASEPRSEINDLISQVNSTS